MRPLFSPESVLVVGVSPRPDNLAANIVRNLLLASYPGAIHLFGRRPGYLFGHRILTEWDEVPEGIAVAVLLVPASQVVEAMDHIGRRGIRWAVVESGGFDEHAGGEDLAERLRAVAALHGIRFVGPNGLGVISMPSRFAVPFALLPALPRPSGVDLLAQSGGVGMYYLMRFAEEGLGLGTFVSMGNKLDLDESDLLEHLARDDQRAVCLYLEGVKDGRRLFDVLDGYRAPVVVQKSNVSRAGARAASSHTAAVAVDDRVLDAAIRQAGAVRVQSMEDMVTHVKAYTLPELAGDRLLIVSRSGGHAVILADLAERYGFELPELPESVAEIMRAGRRARVIEPQNPLDLGDVFDMEVYRRIVEAGLASDEIDGVVFVHTYGLGPEQLPSRRLLGEIAQLSRAYHKPVYASMLCSSDETAALRREYDFVLFHSPEETMLAAAAARERRRVVEAGPRVPMDLPGLADPGRIQSLLDQCGPGQVPAPVALELLEAAGIPVAPFGVAPGADDAAALAERIGFPVVMKLLLPGVTHKSDSGGVVLGVSSPDDVREVFARLQELAGTVAPGVEPEGILVQRMERGFREVFLGARNDESFGPMVLVGLGGVMVEVFEDISIRLLPLARRDLDALLTEPVSFKAFAGARSVPPADLGFLEDAIARVSRLILDFPRIKELDVNPVKVYRAGRGGVAVDARMFLR